jgi:hypothetical protein
MGRWRRTEPGSQRDDAGAVLFGEHPDQLGRKEPSNPTDVVGRPFGEQRRGYLRDGFDALGFIVEL